MSDSATVAAAPAPAAPAYKPKKISVWRRSPSLLVGVVLVALTCLVAATFMIALSGRYGYRKGGLSPKAKAKAENGD